MGPGDEVGNNITIIGYVKITGTKKPEKTWLSRCPKIKSTKMTGMTI